jgi:hypothetical protein
MMGAMWSPAGSRCTPLSPPAGAFVAPRPLALAVIGLLAVDIVLAWLALVGAATFIERVWHGLGGHVIREGTLADHAAQLDWVRRLQPVAWSATAVLFLRWVHRTHANLPALGAHRLGYTPRWAVGAFFVPLLNLVHPVQVLREIWHGSAPACSGDERPGRGPMPAWLPWWWLLVVVAVVADPFPAPLLDGAAAGLDLGPGMQGLVVAGLAEIAAAVLAIVIVRRITAFQEGARERPARRRAAP